MNVKNKYDYSELSNNNESEMIKALDYVLNLKTERWLAQPKRLCFKG